MESNRNSYFPIIWGKSSIHALKMILGITKAFEWILYILGINHANQACFFIEIHIKRIWIVDNTILSFRNVLWKYFNVSSSHQMTKNLK